MSYRNRKRDIATLQLQFITTMIKLAKLQVPVVAVWFDDDSIQTHGTKRLKNFINNANREELFRHTAVRHELVRVNSTKKKKDLILNSQPWLPKYANIFSRDFANLRKGVKICTSVNCVRATSVQMIHVSTDTPNHVDISSPLGIARTGMNATIVMRYL